MARYVDAKCKLCRREGAKLFLKGPKCNSEKCPFSRRPFAPGMGGKLNRSKPSYYAMQLREKQKVKRMYGMLEKQFRRFFALAESSKTESGRKLIELLERRLDNVVYKALFFLSLNQARQMVRHGVVFSGRKRINIPSYIVRQGEKIEIKASDKIKKQIKENIEINAKEKSVPGWLKVDKDELKITIERLPEKEDLVIPINEQFIVELYSK